MTKKSFSARDHRRFTEIKEELHVLLPDTRPRSEAVHRCAVLFAEVRDKGYQQIDGHEEVEKWMWRVFKVGDRQARKWFNAATLPAAEVRGKRQGIEVMGGQIALEPDPAVRAALWSLAEDEGCSATALSAGRMKLREHGDRGDQAAGIAAMQKAARQKAEEEEAERTRKRATPRSAVVRAQDALGQAGRQVGRVRAGKAEATDEEVLALLGVSRDVYEGLRQEAEARGLLQPAGKFETSATATATAPAAPPPPASLLMPLDAAPYRPLFRFLHEELPIDRQHRVQLRLSGIVNGPNPIRRVAELLGDVQPYLANTRPGRGDPATGPARPPRHLPRAARPALRLSRAAVNIGWPDPVIVAVSSSYISCSV